MEADPKDLPDRRKLVQLEEEIARNISELTSANKRLKRKIFDLYTIFEISKHLNSVLDTQSLLDGIIFTVIGQMGVSGCAIFTVAPDNSGLTLAKSKGLMLDPAFDYTIPFESRLFHEIEAVPNAAQEMRALMSKRPAPEELAVLRRLDCELVVPMALKSKICGLLVVTGKISATPFIEDDSDFLVILANQLSVAVENARLFESEKRAYNQLSQTQRQLIETERLAALGQLSARVAHEVNNPLGIIKNYLELISRSADSDHPVAGYVGILNEEVDRIARIVRQLLDFYRPQSSQKARVDLARVLDETILLVSVQLNSRGIKLVRHYPATLPQVFAASEQLKQVFLNLIMNSRDFVEDGGEIRITGAVEGRAVRLTFADNGVGIQPGTLSRIFEPFFTTKKDGAGTGLGLSVCYGIIQSHGGEITANNRPEGGAEFTIRLPIDESAAH